MHHYAKISMVANQLCHSWHLRLSNQHVLPDYQGLLGAQAAFSTVLVRKAPICAVAESVWIDAQSLINIGATELHSAFLPKQVKDHVRLCCCSHRCSCNFYAGFPLLF
ncbi:hypothetical protein F4821DRAFT_14540 [Hypoxylon rubiginosum]|uniref:Uncharacterized protein n=1 Tax=Hypoxylon rubiginosum TaxID=110542 RepID=A0ACC0CP05_9PEZI|nr:hypothetical protein F4821DRAFT_14540 [Hypoxylon rubiginosum]